MGEKFNSGYGGYTCDQCSVLLWAGVRGMERPEKRRFIYSAGPETVVEDKEHAFCSQKCAEEFKNAKVRV